MCPLHCHAGFICGQSEISEWLILIFLANCPTARPSSCTYGSKRCARRTASCCAPSVRVSLIMLLATTSCGAATLRCPAPWPQCYADVSVHVTFACPSIGKCPDDSLIICVAVWVRAPSQSLRNARLASMLGGLANVRHACGAGWVEALEEILHNSRAPQILRQPDGTYLFAVQVRRTASQAGLACIAELVGRAYALLPIISKFVVLRPSMRPTSAQTSAIARCTEQQTNTPLHKC